VRMATFGSAGVFARRLIPFTGSVPRRRDDAPAGPGQVALGGGDVPPGANTDAKPKARVRRWQEAKPMHEAGVVSRVPRGSRHAQAWEADRNTNRTGYTHQHGAGRTNGRTMATVIVAARNETTEGVQVEDGSVPRMAVNGTVPRFEGRLPEASAAALVCTPTAINGTVHPDVRPRPPRRTSNAARRQ
jgi:hypothetical protein